ncbi:hypothetical protein V22_00770 [Calycomorphotria hydatis]|uniref:Uncharacterized protein n=1 Tax=Calycomorphotria hydatis TaxID=2528027 RepID=A0A517T3D5_9PLAN|nr:hypothetical protein V22_00770 [Calycomorphotria hydatis]
MKRIVAGTGMNGTETEASAEEGIEYYFPWMRVISWESLVSVHCLVLLVFYPSLMPIMSVRRFYPLGLNHCEHFFFVVFASCALVFGISAARQETRPVGVFLGSISAVIGLILLLMWTSVMLPLAVNEFFYQLNWWLCFLSKLI